MTSNKNFGAACCGWNGTQVAAGAIQANPTRM
jgi:hypothetical protein